MQYLVLGRCGMDDVPLRLCATRKEADSFARTVTEDLVVRMAGDVFDVDVSVFCDVSIVPIDAKGRPRKFIWVKD